MQFIFEVMIESKTASWLVT